MNGNQAFPRIGFTDVHSHEGGSVSLGLSVNYEIPVLAVNLGLPDPKGWVKSQVFDVAWVQVLAFASACIGIVLVVQFIKAFRS